MLEILQYDDLIGISYKRHGRSKEEGFDCYWLCWFLRKRLGRPIPEKEFSAFKIVRSGQVEQFKSQWSKLRKPKPYCIVHFMAGDLRTHVGLVLADCKRFLEVDDKIGVHIEKLSAVWARMKLAGYYEYECDGTIP